jgi:hypothetical protein
MYQCRSGAFSSPKGSIAALKGDRSTCGFNVLIIKTEFNASLPRFILFSSDSVMNCVI